MLPVSVTAFTLTLTLLAGNATVFGVDLALAVLILHLCLFLSKGAVKFSLIELIFALISLSLIFVLVLRSTTLGIAYYEQEVYWLWAVKAYLGFYLVFFCRGLGWNEVSTSLLLMFSIILLLMGDIVDGRFYSLFGPNMLYRFFTLLALLGVYALIMSKRRQFLTLFVFFWDALE